MSTPTVEADEKTDVERALDAAKITYRRLDYWAAKGWLRPEGGVGSGRVRKWSDAELEVAARMGRYVDDLGVSPPIAAYAARNGGLTPSGGRLVLPEEVADVAPEPEAVFA
jgi:hypothetical protein